MTAAWRDRKRPLWLLGLVMPLLPFIAIAGHASTGWPVWLWIGPLVILGLVPIVDLAVGLDPSNPPQDAIEALERDRYYRWLTFCFLPLQYAGLAAAMFYIATATMGTADRIGLAVTVGFIGGLGINTAHELGHKREEAEKWLAKIALAQCAYGHFSIEHNRGHHVRVATPEDPASSRIGESFYRFWPRTVFGSLSSAWSIERERLRRRGQHPFRITNDVLNAWLLTVALWAGLLLWLGPMIAPYLLIQAVIGITLLEAVNYLEHYGLMRQRVGEGDRQRWERVDPSHSWNSNNLATNVLLYHLQRHSDHHAFPIRRYQALRDHVEAPALPTGYAGMILLSLVPPLWRRVMDPRVAAHYGGDMTRANIDPRVRTAVLASYAAPEDAPHAMPSPAADESTLTPSAESTMAHACPGCGYTYRVSDGAPREGFPPGTRWEAVPDDWCCPDCGVREKVDFIAA